MIRKILIVLVFLSINNVAIAAPPIEAYGRLPAAQMVRLSPSGERYAFIAVVGESRRLAAVTDKGEVLLSTDIGNVKVRDIHWVGENRILVWSTSTFDHFLISDGAYEVTSVTNIDLKARKTSPIFDKVAGIAGFVFGYAGAAHVDGHDYGYFIGMTLDYNRLENVYEFIKDHRDLYRVDLSTGDVDRFARGGEGSSHSWVVGNDGNVIAHSVYDSQTGTWRLYAGKEKKQLLLEKITPFGDVELSGPGRKPNTVWITDSSSGVGITEEVSTINGEREILFADVSPDKYLYDPYTGEAIGATTLEFPHALFFDEKLQARLKATRKAFPDLQMDISSFSRGLNRLIVKTDGGNDSGTYWLVNIAAGSADPIGYPYPEIRSAEVGPTQMVSYKAGDGLSIEAVLTLPPGRKPEKLPLIVLPHGGPIGVSDVVGFDWWAQAYASAGYAVLQPNYRGSSGAGKDFIAAGYGQWGRKMQTDLSDGIAFLTAQGIINPKRVCIVGASYGGYAALAGITLQQDIYRCAVSVAGVSSLSEFFAWQKKRHGQTSGATRYWRAVTGADKEGDAVMSVLSPATFAKQTKVPVLLVHGKDDTVVPIDQSEIMAAALRRENKLVEFIEMQGEDHWLSREETRKTMLKASLDFVLKHNPPN